MEQRVEKKEKMKNLVLILVAGLLLLVISVPGLWTKKSTMQSEPDGSISKIHDEPIGSSEEKRFETILSEVKGAGKVEAMIVFRCGDENRGIEGILVVAEGAQNAEIVKDISDATEALFGIPKHKIIILPMQMKGK